MRPLRCFPCVVVALALVTASPSHAGASTGGTAVPDARPAPSNLGGGTPYVRSGRPPPRLLAEGRRTRPAPGPVLASFRLRRSRLFLFGRPARVSFRIRGPVRLAWVRISITPRNGRQPAARIRLGPRPPGRKESVRLTGREAGILAEGVYRLRISARDVHGRRLRRGAGISSTSDLTLHHHRFPLDGRFSYGNAGARFGAPRKGHAHRGQDLAAAEGTPVLAPRGGRVETVAYQAEGAGHYVVLDGAEEERDYVFMHLRTGSIAVREGQIVRTGQTIGQVGNTGRSYGAHLHFEVWGGKGWYTGGRPLDPLPLLRSWEGATRS